MDEERGVCTVREVVELKGGKRLWESIGLGEVRGVEMMAFIHPGF